MKKQLRSILLFIAVPFIILTGCSKSDSLVPPAVNNSPGQNTNVTTTNGVSTPTSVNANAGDNANQKTPITINSEYDLSSYPFLGTFYTHGALEISGTVTMLVDVNSNGNRLHCTYTFVTPEGSFIVHERCIFSTPLQGQGRWDIVSGTGAYTNLKGNGSALMPGNQENWDGFIY